MPENLTRREFLKDLGLLSAGVTLAPVAAQGESLASLMERADAGWRPQSPARPAWVREVDKPTTEVDWDKVQRWDERNTAFNFPRYFGDERLKKLQTIQNENMARFLKESRPGFTLKDYALNEGSRYRAFANVTGAEFPFLGPRTALPPEKRGTPKYTATPEEAARVVAAAARFYGAATVGFVELDPRTTQKLIFSHDGDGKQIEFADVELAEETNDKRIIPNKVRYAIVFTVQMSPDAYYTAPTAIAAATTGFGYEQGGLIQGRLQEFLRALGYQGVGEYSRNALGIAPGLAIYAGLGELSRHNRLLTPEYGPLVRVFKMITDLPLAPSKPVDAGIVEFCKRCKKCAEACPAKAIPFDDEPSWKVRGEFNSPGHKAWFDDAVKCRAYWFEISFGCTICYAACPLARKDKAFMHTFRNWLVANAAATGGALKSLDDLLYGTPDASAKPMKNPADWWKLDLPEFGIDTTRGKRDA
jgi:reductive dehalogenase